MEINGISSYFNGIFWHETFSTAAQERTAWLQRQGRHILKQGENEVTVCECERERERKRVREREKGEESGSSVRATTLSTAKNIYGL